MCGIAGIFDPRGLSPRAVLEPALASILRDVRHRGPDGEGAIFDDGLALGHRRLAILDVSDAGLQPMESRDRRYVLAHNGEIYNHQGLRAALNTSWRGTSDTETVLEMFSAHGLDALSRFCGMFALAVYDRREHLLHLIRDRFGIKPLFFAARAEGGWIFASEARAVARATGAGIRHDVISDYLSWGYPPPQTTLFEGVVAVPPATVVTLSTSGPTEKRYYELPQGRESHPSEKDQDEAFDQAFTRAVKEHQLSDVPIGILLSSGVDSSAVAVASAATDARATAFTVRFGDAGLDESPAANELARKLNLPVTVLNLSSNLDHETLDAVAASSDLPLADSSCVGTWLIAREASKHVKVLLTGDGADETWGGYQTYTATSVVGSPAGQVLRYAGKCLDAALGPARPKTGRPGFRTKLSRFARYARLEPLQAHRRWRTLTDEASLQALGLKAADPTFFQTHVDRASSRKGVNGALALDVSTYMLQDELARLDRMAMAHGMEGRVPFLDHRLVELAFSWKSEVKRRLGVGKRPVRRWLEGQGFERPARVGKLGFNHPVAAWMAGSAGDWLLDGRQELSHLLDATPIETWVVEHREGRRDRSYELFALLILVSWLRSARPGKKWVNGDDIPGSLLR